MQQPESNPHIESFDDADLAGLARTVSAVTEREKVRWEETPKLPSCERSDRPARLGNRRPQASIREQQQMPRLFRGERAGRREISVRRRGRVASFAAQYVSFGIAPSGFGDPGLLHYSLNTHHFEHRADVTSPYCAFESAEGVGDFRVSLTGRHDLTERHRRFSRSTGPKTRVLRRIDDRTLAMATFLNRLGG